MRRRPFPLVLALVASSVLASAASPARADDGADDTPLRGPRVGFLPTVGAGIAGFTGLHGGYPSFIGTSVLQLDFVVDTGRWGVLARGAYLSSGSGGFWTAPVAAVAGTYRILGDGEEQWGIVARAGVLYQRWHIVPDSCAPALFIPSGCNNFVAPQDPLTPTGPSLNRIIADDVGLVAGASFEIPVEPVFLALGAEVSATVDVDNASPGLALAGQLTFSFALRDHARDRRTQYQPRVRRHYDY